MRRSSVVLACVLVLGGLLSACGTSGAADGRIHVVASTNVWGDVARQVGGDRVEVTAFITNPSADPHSFEASAENQLAISRAQVIVENGGGYDDFMQRMVKASGASAAVIDAVQVSGRKPDAEGELNEHVWYDLPTVEVVATRIEHDLAAADPAGKAAYEKNLAAFVAQVQALRTSLGNAAGKPVGITEPVPMYLLSAMGLTVATPPAFSKAIEEGEGVPALLLQQVKDQFASHQVRALVYNAQTSGPETTAVLDAAAAAHVPTVPVTETVPAGETYISWMTSQIEAIKKAVP